MLKFSLLCAAVFLAGSTAQAGFIGTGSGNDIGASGPDNVLAVITAWNTANNPDLPTTFTQFKNTDDDGAFVFNAANGFDFYSNPAPSGAVLSAGALHSMVTAYFTYDGPQSLLYYSVKSSTAFDLYLFDPGVVNLLNVGSQDISHVTFWTGLRPPVPGPELPEPASAVLLLLGVAGAAGGRRLMRPKNPAIDS